MRSTALDQVVKQVSPVGFAGGAGGGCGRGGEQNRVGKLGVAAKRDLCIGRNALRENDQGLADEHPGPGRGKGGERQIRGGALGIKVDERAKVAGVRLRTARARHDKPLRGERGDGELWQPPHQHARDFPGDLREALGEEGVAERIGVA